MSDYSTVEEKELHARLLEAEALLYDLFKDVAQTPEPEDTSEWLESDKTVARFWDKLNEYFGGSEI